MRIAMRSAATYILEPVFAPVPVPGPETASFMQSPCVRVCSIDPGTGLCAGCGRSIQEIAGWTEMTDDERQRIMSTLSARRRQAVLAAGR